MESFTKVLKGISRVNDNHLKKSLQSEKRGRGVDPKNKRLPLPKVDDEHSLLFAIWVNG